MATLLRSLHFVRRLNVARTRLVAPLHEKSLLMTHVKPQYLGCSIIKQNYIIGLAMKESDIDYTFTELNNKELKYNLHIRKSFLDQLLKTVTQAGTLTSSQALILIRCCGNHLMPEKQETRRVLTEHVFQTIKDLGVQMDIFHYNALILIHLENETDFSPAEILAEMQANNIKPNLVTFQRILEYYGNKGDVTNATKILEYMSKEDVSITEYTFASLIKGHSNAGDLNSAVQILDVMTKSGINPSSLSYSAILCAYAKEGDIQGIRKTLAECNTKKIILMDNQYLEIIYTLAINNHKEHVNEMLQKIVNGLSNNKSPIEYIDKLIEKDQIEVAYKVLVSASVKKEATGTFFIRKLAKCNADAPTVIRYCEALHTDGLHDDPLDKALLYSLLYHPIELSLPLLQYMKEKGVPIREQYFYPILTAHMKASNLQGILNVVKSMNVEFSIIPSTFCLENFVLPCYTFEVPRNIVTNLVNCNVPFNSAIISTFSRLLSEGKMRQAAQLLCSTKLLVELNVIQNRLSTAFAHVKDIQATNEILYHQYILRQSDSNEVVDNNENEKEQLSAEKSQHESSKQFIHHMIVNMISELPQYETEIIIKLLQSLSKSGLSADKKLVDDVKLLLGNNYTPQISDILSDLTFDKVFNDKVSTPMKINWKNNTSSPYNQLSDALYAVRMNQNQAENNDSNIAELVKKVEDNGSYTPSLCVSLVQYYSRTKNLDNAYKWFKRVMEINPYYKFPKVILVKYTRLLVQNNRAEDALEALNCPIIDSATNASRAAGWLLMDVIQNCPDKVQNFLDKIKEIVSQNQFTVKELRPVVSMYLKSNNIEKALETIEWIAKTYKLTPENHKLMNQLIKNENIEGLQRLINLNSSLYGQSNALLNLAVALCECDQMHQARKVIQVPDLAAGYANIEYVANKFMQEGETGKLENLIKLFSGKLRNIEPVYQNLLMAYDKEDNWQKCLELWIQMQENKINPSTKFMVQLKQILNRHNQQLPFQSVSKELRFFNENVQKIISLMQNNNLDDATVHLRQVLKKMQSTYYANEVITGPLEKLIETNNFDSIYKLLSGTKFEEIGRLTHIIHQYYLKKGKYEQFITDLERIITNNAYNKKLINKFINNTATASVLSQQPHLMESFMKFANKALEHGDVKPIYVAWTVEFIKDSPAAEEIWNSSLSKVITVDEGYRMMKLIKSLNARQKLPALVDKLLELEQFKINAKIFNSILKTITSSDAEDRYQVAYECLHRITKVINEDKLDLSVVHEIERNLTDQLSKDSLKTYQGEQ